MSLIPQRHSHGRRYKYMETFTERSAITLEVCLSRIRCAMSVHSSISPEDEMSLVIVADCWR